MDLRRRCFDRFRLPGLIVLGLVAICAGTASARTEVLRWTHPDSGAVASWEAHVGDSSGSYDRIVPFSNPQVDSDGVLQMSIEVDDDAVVYIALRAIGVAGERSGLSNERERSPDGGTPMPTTPPEPPVLIQVVPATP